MIDDYVYNSRCYGLYYYNYRLLSFLLHLYMYSFTKWFLKMWGTSIKISKDLEWNKPGVCTVKMQYSCLKTTKIFINRQHLIVKYFTSLSILVLNVLVCFILSFFWEDIPFAKIAINQDLNTYESMTFFLLPRFVELNKNKCVSRLRQKYENSFISVKEDCVSILLCIH